MNPRQAKAIASAQRRLDAVARRLLDEQLQADAAEATAAVDVGGADHVAHEPAPLAQRQPGPRRANVDLDLIPYLHPDEQIEAVRVLGLARAYRRLGGFVDA